jgi:C1A family cysteine protease
MKKQLITYVSLALVAGFTSCKKEKDIEEDTNNNNSSSVVTGWNGSDDPSTVPSAINFVNSGALPSSYDLIPKFPPVGDQGQYGTCVAWASGYNMKSALEGMDRGLTTGQLASASNQISPRDLFTAIPDASKGQNCNGTDFTDALDLLLNRGAATLQTVPYTSLNGCSNSNTQSNWTQEAGSHRIKSYRKINMDVNEIKQNIASNIPVLCGAKLSDNFQTWNDDNVLSSNTTYNNVGIHAYHALLVAGFDDNKGPGGAFRVINSWSTQWGDHGYIWVDYNFFVSEFCYGGNVYIAVNDNGNNPPPNNDTTVTGSVDLAAWAFNDFSTSSTTGYSNSRQIEYNIYNIGDQAASSSMDWSVCYIYFNAYDANDYGFLFYDDFNTTIAPGTYDCPTSDHCIINADIQPGDNVANTVFQSNTLYQDYFVPNITGEYYLVMIADAYDKFGEPDEQNNLFYTTDQYPVYFINGVVQRNGGKPAVALQNYQFKNNLMPDKSTLKNNPYKTCVNKTYPNAYHFDEIKRMISQQKGTAKWNKKIQEFKNRAKVKK